MKILRNLLGVTVAQLKAHIADWPEVDAAGNPTEVWISTGEGTSSPCVAVDPLNIRKTEGGDATSDLLFCA